MDRILKKFPECNVFSLTGSIRYFNTEKYKELYNKKNGRIDSEESKKEWVRYDVDGKIRKVKYLPASLCEIDTRLKKE